VKAGFFGSNRSGPRPDPTRDELACLKLSFQGLEFDTPSYGHVFWWETMSWWPNSLDRAIAYDAKRKAGDTHCTMDLTGSYGEIDPVYDQIGADWSNNLDGLVELCREAIDQGFLIDLPMGGDGQSVRTDGSTIHFGEYNDPVGRTYGFQWLMQNFSRIAEAFRPIYRFVAFRLGYDGVFYGWTPDQVVAFGKLFRSIFPDGVLVIEFNTGHIPLGEGPGYRDAYEPGGCMQDYDTILGEFDPDNVHQDSTWQILGRLIRPYNRPSDEPAGDDERPPFLLSHPNKRGRWWFIPYEIETYNWVRGRKSRQQCIDNASYFMQMGCAKETMCYPNDMLTA
jgi:hypothetical protein